RGACSTSSRRAGATTTTAYGPISEVATPLKGPAQELLKRLNDLTSQQLRILELIHRGLQNKQIAYELQICESTVKVHVSDILRKLKVGSRTKAIVEMSKIDFANLTSQGSRRPAQASHRRRERDFCRRRQAPQHCLRDETYAQRRKSRPHDREKPA